MVRKIENAALRTSDALWCEVVRGNLCDFFPVKRGKLCDFFSGKAREIVRTSCEAALAHHLPHHGYLIHCFPSPHPSLRCTLSFTAPFAAPFPSLHPFLHCTLPLFPDVFISLPRPFLIPSSSLPRPYPCLCSPPSFSFIHVIIPFIHLFSAHFSSMVPHSLPISLHKIKLDYICHYIIT